MNEFRAKMAENGRIIIPAAIRHELGLLPGEELIIRLANDELHIFSLKHSLKKAQTTVQKYAKKQSLVHKLKMMRREDSDNEG